MEYDLDAIITTRIAELVKGVTKDTKPEELFVIHSMLNALDKVKQMDDSWIKEAAKQVITAKSDV